MDIYERLGVHRIINAAGTLTTLGGSIMPSEVLEAMREAAGSFIEMHEFHKKAGERIAGLIGVEAAHICACATAGISLMAAACMTGTDAKSAAKLPHTEGLKNRFVVQTTQRTGFDRAVLVAGGEFVEIPPDLSHLEEALDNDDNNGDLAVAAVLYTCAWVCDGPAIPLSEVCRAAHERGIPVIVDAAAELPPAANLTRFIEEGADLVTFSGGKMLRGPQASGLILGRRELIEACALNDGPNVGVARGMKVGKEEIAGLVRAVELYLERDHAEDSREWDARVDFALERLANHHGIRVEKEIPPGVGQHIPFLMLSIDEKVCVISNADLAQRLKRCETPIVVQHLTASDDVNRKPRRDQLRLHPHTLSPGEIEIVVDAITSELKEIT